VTFEPFLAAGPVIQSHVMAAALALGVGAFQLAAPKGGARHRLSGYIWVALMVYICLSGFFIHEIRMLGPFSPIHLLSAFTLLALFWAVLSARRGDITGHQRAMRAVYWLALIVTGAFTLLPGRVMFRILFG